GLGHMRNLARVAHALMTELDAIGPGGHGLPERDVVHERIRGQFEPSLELSAALARCRRCKTTRGFSNASRERVGHFLRAEGVPGKLDPTAGVCQVDFGLLDPRLTCRRFQQPATECSLAGVDDPGVANPNRLLLRIDVDVGPGSRLTLGRNSMPLRTLFLSGA